MAETSAYQEDVMPAQPRVKHPDKYYLAFTKEVAEVMKVSGYTKRLKEKTDADLTLVEWVCVPEERRREAIMRIGADYVPDGSKFVACMRRTQAVVLYTLLHPELMKGNGFNALWPLVAGHRQFSKKSRSKTAQSLTHLINKRLKLKNDSPDKLMEDGADILRKAWGAPYSKADRGVDYIPAETNRAFDFVTWALDVQAFMQDKTKRKPPAPPPVQKELFDADNKPLVKTTTTAAVELEETAARMGDSFQRLKAHVEGFILPDAQRAKNAVLKSNNLTLDGRERLFAIIEGLDYKAATERMNRLKQKK